MVFPALYDRCVPGLAGDATYLLSHVSAMEPDLSITVYSTPTCPDCRVLKAWLTRSGLAFSERDLTDPAIMDEAKRRFGVRIAPITEVDDWFTFGTFEDQKPRIEARLRETRAWPA